MRCTYKSSVLLVKRLWVSTPVFFCCFSHCADSLTGKKKKPRKKNLRYPLSTRFCAPQLRKKKTQKRESEVSIHTMGLREETKTTTTYLTKLRVLSDDDNAKGKERGRLNRKAPVPLCGLLQDTLSSLVLFCLFLSCGSSCLVRRKVGAHRHQRNVKVHPRRHALARPVSLFV
jgi:hypothetical protein